MKTVLVTGGSRGIGREIVRLFSSKGYKAVFFYNKSEAEAQSLMSETGAIGIKCDVSDPGGRRLRLSRCFGK